MLGLWLISTKSSSLSLPGGSYAPILPQSLSSSQPQSRQASVARNDPPRALPQTSAEVGRKSTQARKQTSKRKLRSTSPRPPPPTISLPDPSEPPPTHFLRNQHALLGHAGLIAGVQPSKLTTLGGAGRGASPSNPIVLDDNETEAPCESSVLISRSQIEYFKNLDRSQLPTPNIQEVVDMLIKQRDIFPVLQSILRLLAVGATGGPGQGSFATRSRGWASKPGQRPASVQPQVKRRKLNRVPAGAADWDVPYPFLDGEGPEAYRQNWMKERGRQLVSQLIGLVKVALDKAAAKKHIEELTQKEREDENGSRQKSIPLDQPEGGRGANHYRDECGDAFRPTVLPSMVKATTVPSSANLTSPPNQSAPKPMLAMANSDNGMINDLFSTLLSASDSTPLSNPVPVQSSPPADLLDTSQPVDNFLAAFDLSSPGNENADQSLVDSWMNILQTFSSSGEGSNATVGPLTNSTSFESLFGIDTPSDFSTFPSPLSGDASSFSTTPNPDAQQLLSFPPLDLTQAGNLDLALSLVAGDALGTTPGLLQTPVNASLLPSPTQDDPKQQGEALPSHSVATPMDVDEAPPSLALPEIQSDLSSKLSPPSLSMDIDHLVDPCLLAISFPGAPQVRAQLGTSVSDVENPESLISLPSPASTLEPTTPSSAGWDLSLPGVVAGEQCRLQDPGEQLPASGVVSKGSSINTPIDEVLTRPITGQAPPQQHTSPSASTSEAPAPQPPGVFSVVRVEDWQPQKPKHKLKKADVLKRAEEKREKLRARLEQTKVKLWETTIEHGALLQLMRITGEEGRESPPSPSGS